MSKREIKVDDIVLLKNNLIGSLRSFHKNRSVLTLLWISLTNELVATLKNASGVTLKNKYNIVQLKYYTPGADDKSKSTSNEEAGDFWNHAPDENVEMILLYVVQQTENSYSGHRCDTYASIKSKCCKWAHIIEEKGLALLPKIYIDTWNPLRKPYNRKTIVSIKKLTSTFGKPSGLASQFSNCIDDKKRSSSRLFLTPGKHSWHTIDRIFWKTMVCQPDQSSSQRTSSWLKNELYQLTEADREILEREGKMVCWTMTLWTQNNN